MTPSWLSLSLGRRIGRNALAKLISELLGRLASFALVLLAARQLGTAGFGLYNYALAWGFVLAQLADLGLQLVVARELAVGSRQSAVGSGDEYNVQWVVSSGQRAEHEEQVVDRQQRTEPVSRIFSTHQSDMAANSSLVPIALQWKLLLSLVVVVLLLSLATGWGVPERLGLLCLTLSPLLNTFVEFTGYVFRGRQELLTEVRLLTAARLTTAIAGIIVLLLAPASDLLWLGVVTLLLAALFVGLSLRLLRREGWLNRYQEVINYRLFIRQWPVAHVLFQQALPLGIAIFLSIAYTRLAILLLQTRLGEVAVAHFSAAARLVEPAQIIPASLMAAVFPAFTSSLGRAPDEARTLGIRATSLLALLGVGAAVGLWLLAPTLVVWLYGPAFADSIRVLRILILGIPVLFINYSLTHYLIARGQQRLVGIFTGIMLVFHAAICWWAIPILGTTGPAISTILAELLLLFACLITLGHTKPRLSVVSPHVSLTYSPPPQP